MSSPQPINGIDLYWLPLGAGGHSVRLNGRVFEAVVSRLEHRPACDLYHSALEVRVPEGRYVIEQAPVPDGDGAWRGVAAGGCEGDRRARESGRSRGERVGTVDWSQRPRSDGGDTGRVRRRVCAGDAYAARFGNGPAHPRTRQLTNKPRGVSTRGAPR